MTSSAEELLPASACDIDVRLPVKSLTIAERQAVEIAKALSIDARVLVMDEPTSAIAGPRGRPPVRDRRAICKQEGVAILFISHFIDEILGLERRHDGPALRQARRHRAGRRR